MSETRRTSKWSFFFLCLAVAALAFAICFLIFPTETTASSQMPQQAAEVRTLSSENTTPVAQAVSVVPVTTAAPTTVVIPSTLSATAATTVVTTTVPANEFPNYTAFDRDTVIALQTALNNQGYSLNIDGVFGPMTAEAVWNYQKANGLTLDALAGKQTAGKLGVTLPEGVKSLRYVTDLETYARTSSRPYLVYIDRQSKVDGKVKPTISVYGLRSDGHWALLYCRLCGIGENSTPTPVGVWTVYSNTMEAFDRGNDTYQWNYPLWLSNPNLGGNTNYGIHSTTFVKSSRTYLSTSNQIGCKVSHGCIRVEPELAKWLWDNVGVGAYVCIDDRGHTATLTGLPTTY